MRNESDMKERNFNVTGSVSQFICMCVCMWLVCAFQQLLKCLYLSTSTVCGHTGMPVRYRSVVYRYTVRVC